MTECANATMTDEELLNHYRQKRGNSYLTLTTARALDALDKKYGCLGREQELSGQHQGPGAG
jgi:hypothetical protein